MIDHRAILCTARRVISRCIGFDPCRYYGSKIPSPVVVHLKTYADCIPACPEGEGRYGRWLTVFRQKNRKKRHKKARQKPILDMAANNSPAGILTDTGRPQPARGHPPAFRGHALP